MMGAPGRFAGKSNKLPIVLLLLALGLLVAGLYYSGLISSIFEPSVRSGNPTVINPPVEVKSAPVTIAPSAPPDVVPPAVKSATEESSPTGQTSSELAQGQVSAVTPAKKAAIAACPVALRLLLRMLLLMNRS